MRREEWHWLLIIIPLLLTLIEPVQWLAKVYQVSGDALGFQPFVPLGVGILAWSERHSVAGTYHGLAELYPPESKMRRGTPLIAYAGCIVLALAFVTTIAALSVVGLLIMALGILLYLYGPTVTRALWRPILFSVTMIPIPGSLLDFSTSRLQLGCATAAGALLKLFYPQAKTMGNFININSYTAQVSGPCSGVGILLPVLVLTFFLALLRRMPWTITLILLGSAAGISLLMNTIRIVIMGLIGVQNAHLAETLHDANSWIFTALAFYLTFLLAGRVGPRVYRYADGDEE